MEETLAKILADFLKGSVLGEVLVLVGLACGMVFYIHKIYKGFKSDSRQEELDDDQTVFRHDILSQLRETREENADLTDKIEGLMDRAHQSELALRTIKMNMQVFRIVLKNRADDPKLLELFENIANFSVVSDENSLRRLGLSRSLASAAIKNRNHIVDF